jgi:hypothetical protein
LHLRAPVVSIDVLSINATLTARRRRAPDAARRRVGLSLRGTKWDDADEGWGMVDARNRWDLEGRDDDSARSETSYQVIRSDTRRGMGEQNTVDDRRKFARRRLALVVHMRFPTLDAAVESETIDISRSGVFLQTPDLRPVGTPVRLSFVVDGRQLVVHGVVVRTVNRQGAPIGMGIAFDRPVADDSGLFEQLVDKKQARATAERRLRDAPHR